MCLIISVCVSLFQRPMPGHMSALYGSPLVKEALASAISRMLLAPSSSSSPSPPPPPSDSAARGIRPSHERKADIERTLRLARGFPSFQFVALVPSLCNHKIFVFYRSETRITRILLARTPPTSRYSKLTFKFTARGRSPPRDRLLFRSSLLPLSLSSSPHSSLEAGEKPLPFL